mgnify:CR=1 FL=1
MQDEAVRPYSGIRIIDLTRELGSYCGRLFADLGAEVIRVEPPGGRSDRWMPPSMPGAGEVGGVPFHFLNANKKSVILDRSVPEGAQVFRDLVAAAQVVLYEADEDRDAALGEILGVPGTRVVTAFSYFGLTGPYRDFVGCDLVAQAAGGIAWLSGEPGKPPLHLAGRQSVFVTSLYAATATAICLWDGERTGDRHLLDVSAQECVAHSLQNAVQVYDLEGRVARRGGEGTRDATESAFRCADGHVFLAAPLALSGSWGGLVDWMREEGFPGHERLLEPDWNDRPLRATEPMRREFRALFERFLGGRTKAELRREALRRRICLAPVSGIADLQDDPQLVARGFFRTLGGLAFPGAPFRLSEPVWRLDRAAPAPGQDDAAIPGAAAPGRM